MSNIFSVIQLFKGDMDGSQQTGNVLRSARSGLAGKGAGGLRSFGYPRPTW